MDSRYPTFKLAKENTINTIDILRSRGSQRSVRGQVAHLIVGRNGTTKNTVINRRTTEILVPHGKQSTIFANQLKCVKVKRSETAY